MELDEILLGDAYELIKGIPDKKIDLIVTDPPYLIGGLSANKGGLFKGRNMSNSYVTEMGISNLGDGIDISIMEQFVRVMKKTNIYIWCNKDQIYDYMTFFCGKMKCNFEIIIWSKTNPPPFTAGHYLKDKEYCLYFWEKGAQLKGNFQTMRTVYQSTINIDDKNKFCHPTIKPVEIIKNLVSNSSSIGDIVLDPFIGSGTTAVAAKELGRHYIGFEINPEYHKIATDRVNGIDHSGQTSLLDTDFEQMNLLEGDGDGNK